MKIKLQNEASGSRVMTLSDTKGIIHGHERAITTTDANYNRRMQEVRMKEPQYPNQIFEIMTGCNNSFLDSLFREQGKFLHQRNKIRTYAQKYADKYSVSGLCLKREQYSMLTESRHSWNCSFRVILTG